MTSSRLSLALICLLFALCAQAIDEPEGYRLDTYDAPVPLTLRGSKRVTAIEVKDLMAEHGALVIDVIPEHRKPDTLPEGQIWFSVPHTGVQGAMWLPDVGYGALSATTEKYLKYHLRKATLSQLDHPLVFYCRIDCWMSWNAAKRALAYGYKQVYWFADGLSDWEFEDYPTQILQPAPGKRH